MPTQQTVSVRINYKSRPQDLQEIAPGVFMGLPGTATFEPVDIGGAPYAVAITFGMTADGPRPAAVTVTAAEGSPPVTSSTLRAVKVWDLARAGIITGAHRGRSEATSDGGTATELLSTSLTDQDIELIRLRGPVRESLEWAAWFYNLARVLGLPPAKQVELELGLPRTTAAKWIRRARDMGLISPTEGSTNGKR